MKRSVMNLSDDERRREAERMLEDYEARGLVRRTPDGKWIGTEAGRQWARTFLDEVE